MTPLNTRQPLPVQRHLLARLFGACMVAAIVAVVVPSTSSAEGTMADELARGYREAQAIAEELAEIETLLANLEADIEQFDERIAAIRAELELLRQNVRDIAVQRYVVASNGPVVLGDDPMEYQRFDVLMSAVQHDSQATLAAYREVRAQLESSNRELADRIADQHTARDRLAGRLVDLNEELTRLAELQRRAELEAARLDAERRQQAALAAARAATTTTAAPTTTVASASTSATVPSATVPSVTTTTSAGQGTTTSPTTTTAAPTTTTTVSPPTTAPPPPSSSGFLCPVRGVSVFTDTWGAPRSGGRQHMGVDMLASIGTPAVAPVAGTVEHRWNNTGGHSYHLNGVDGNYYYGTHLSAYGESGQVAAGTVIGYVGDSGNAAGIPHLHFEIHIGGRGNPINPTPTVRAACG